MQEKISGVILAGGLGRRMGGGDKGLQVLEGKPMVQSVLERFAPQVDDVLINVNRNLDRYQIFGHKLIPDEVPGFVGPLAGLQAALKRAEHPLVATAPCDSPFLPANLVARLRTALTATGASLAVACTRGRAQPVFCLCRRELLPHLSAYLERGGRKVYDWYATLDLVEVSFDDEAEAFRNINTQEELLAACSRRIF